MSNKQDRTLKICIIGEGSAGKTSLRSRYLHNSFQKAYISTIGTDFVSRTIDVTVPVPRSSNGKGKAKNGAKGDVIPNGKVATPSSAPLESQATHRNANGIAGASTSAQPIQFEQENVKVSLQIWDTAGQERFKSLGSAFYRGSDAVIIAFDLNAKGALARTVNWFNDFCRLGDVAYEEKGMNVRQLKKAREQRERFCWVGVGCKADLLSERKDDDQSELRGTSWPEARGWFDTILPRFLPEGAEERQGYRGEPSTSATGQVVPYQIGQDVPARPEDVLSRPNRTTSISVPGISIDSDVQLGRPSDAGLAPGTAPAPGTSASQWHPRKSLGGSKSRKGRNGSRKSIRSIEVWQNDHQFPSSSESKASRSTSAATMKGVRHDGTPRSRFSSAASIGAPSVYYSVRGSTLFGHSPAGAKSALGLDMGDDASHNGNMSTESDLQDGMSSNDSQSRKSKQSHLSQIAGENDSNTSKDESIANPSNQSQRTHSSSDTIRGADAKVTARKPSAADSSSEVKGKDSIEEDGISVPTIPSGDPIPFPSGDEEDEDDATQHEVPVRRGSRQQKARSTIIHNDITEGETGRKVKSIAREAQQQRLESEEEHQNGQAEVDKRATLYSARPSSISSTVKGVDEVSSEQNCAADEEEEEPGVVYRDQMIEQGFRLFFTSAKEGHGIDEVFEHIARRVAIRWKLEEWEEQREQEMGLVNEEGQVQTAPPTDEDLERERIKRAIKISSGKGTGNCCS